MHPHKSFLLWFTPRTGSTLLCKGLELTGIAGRPGELFNIPEDGSLAAHYGARNYQELHNRLWREGTSPNGVMGAKYSLYRHLHDRLADELAMLRNIGDFHRLDWRLWEDIFPGCRHVYLCRRNKIRLAVSWWKAIQDEQWHRQRGEKPRQRAEFYADKYNFDALLHLLKENNLREAAVQEFFDYNRIEPLTVVYEDFILNYEKTIRRILRYLEVDEKGIQIPPKFYDKTADENSEAWVEQFRADLQKNWERPMW